MTKPSPSSPAKPSGVKRPYSRPRLETHPSWRVLVGQVGSFPAGRLPDAQETK